MFVSTNIVRFDCDGTRRGDRLQGSPCRLAINNSSSNGKPPDIVTLFGKKCEFSNALQSESEWLFNMCRKVLMDLRDMEIDIPKKFSLVNDCTLSPNELALGIRDDISIFLNYVDSYLNLCLKITKDSVEINKELAKLELKLDNLKILIHHFDIYLFSEQFLLQCSPMYGKLQSGPAYQLVHCFLDIRWFFIVVKEKIKRIRNTYSENPIPEDGKISSVFPFIMSELILLSVIKYKWEEGKDVMNEIFTCSCIKEFWLLLLRSLGVEMFWDCFGQVMKAVVYKKCSTDSDTIKNYRFLSSHHFKEINEIEFSLHFLNTIVKIKGEMHLPTGHPLHGSDFTPLYDNVRLYLLSEPTEKSLRSVMPVIASTLEEWKFAQEDVMVMLLEYFYKRFNSAFHVPGTQLKNLETVCKSGMDLLNEVKGRFSPTNLSDKNENSFSLFLRMMGTFVHQSRLEGSAMKKLYSRIYIKFDIPKKFLTFSELGLYHTSSLFLTVAIAYDVEKETKKLHSLMATLKSDGLTPDRKAVKWKSLAACLLLMAESGFDGKDIVNDILREIDETLSRGDTTNVQIFVECLQFLIENRNSYLSTLVIISSLIDKWIEKYVIVSTVRDRVSLIGIFEPLIEELRHGAVWWSRDEAENIEQKLCLHILPTIKTYVHPSLARIASQFISLFITTKKWAHTYSLYKAWLNSDDMKITRHFVMCFHEVEGTVSRLGTFAPDYEVDIVHCFIRYHVLSEQRNTSDSKFFAEIVRTLPNVTRCLSVADYKWTEEEDALTGFIRLFPLALQKSLSWKDKSFLRELFIKYFKLETWLESGLTSAASNGVIYNIYRYSSLLVDECHSLVYDVSCQLTSPLKTIVDVLLLPSKVYKANYRVPDAVIRILSRHFAVFISGFMKMNPKQNSYIGKIILDAFRIYFGRFNELARNDLESHPFYTCLTASVTNAEYLSLGLIDLFMCDSTSSTTESCLQLFSSVTCPDVRGVIFANCIRRILLMIMELDYSHSLVRRSLEYIRKSVIESDACRNELIRCLESTYQTEKFIGSENLPRLMGHLQKACPVEVSKFTSGLQRGGGQFGVNGGQKSSSIPFVNASSISLI